MRTKICNRSECAGCGLCAALCPRAAITMIADTDGFHYPRIDLDRCVECGKCQEVCPVLSPVTPEPGPIISEPLACWNKDPKIRFISSSGGLFSIFAENIIDKHGVVYGVVFDSCLKTVFARTDSVSGLEPMRGSKYVEAETERLFERLSDDLRQGLPVLFSGTPCQNAALRRYIAALNDVNPSLLYQIDFICHGVSSPLLWKSFVSAIESKYRTKLRYVYFRDKSIGGWKSPSMRFSFQNGKEKCISWSTLFPHIENAFIHIYHKNLGLRTSCANCGLTGIPRQGDITLADAQALYHHPDFASEARNGISMILINTPKGKKLFEESSKSIIFSSRPFTEMKISPSPAVQHPLSASFLKDAGQLDFNGLFKRFRSAFAPPFRFKTLINSLLKSIFGPRLTLLIRETATSLKRSRK